MATLVVMPHPNLLNLKLSTFFSVCSERSRLIILHPTYGLAFILETLKQLTEPDSNFGRFQVSNIFANYE